MESHSDSEYLTQAKLAALRQRAEALNASGENLITAGKPGEISIGELATPHAYVIRRPDDPDALRISIGEGTGIANSRYLVFRGDPRDCLDLLTKAISALRLYITFEPMKNVDA